LVEALEVPFDSSQIEWRVTNTTKNQQPVRGQMIPYANQRAYTDRLNALLTPAGWTRRYTIHTSANFERSKDQKIVAKVLVTCELTIFGVGSHSATGEEWADDDNAGTSAEAQAFSGLAPALGSGVTSITSLGRGSSWMTGNGPSLFRNWPAGQRLKGGCEVFGPLRSAIRSRPGKYPPASGGNGQALHDGNRARAQAALSFARLSRWSKRWEADVSRVVEDPRESVESQRH